MTNCSSIRSREADVLLLDVLQPVSQKLTCRIALERAPDRRVICPRFSSGLKDVKVRCLKGKEEENQWKTNGKQLSKDSKCSDPRPEQLFRLSSELHDELGMMRHSLGDSEP